MLKSDIIQNVSSCSLSADEISVLEKGLNFCPTVKAPDTINLLEDLYFFCRKLKLAEFFHPGQPDAESDDIHDESLLERCEVKTKIKNPYFNPSKKPSDSLSTYISAIKKGVVDLLHKPNRNPSNMTIQEREALKSLRSNEQIVIQEADKGGKIVVMNRQDYIEEVQKQLSNDMFYEKLSRDPNKDYASDVRRIADDLKDQNVIGEADYKFITQHLDQIETPIFYGLPKIHKMFDLFPRVHSIMLQIKSSSTHEALFTENRRNQSKNPISEFDSSQ